MATNGSNTTPGLTPAGLLDQGIFHPVSWRLLVSLALLYPVLCSALRFRRMRAIPKALGFTDRKSMANMTSVQAQTIVRDLSELEFPLLFRKSLQFALFKTYGIPTISSLLVATRMFSDPENASKRYEDTSVLIGEFIAHRPDQPRTRQAIARMNSLHSPYIKAGKISNEDLLYTLSVFVTEPITWINKYEWRRLTDVELCAQGTFWKSIGDAMGIKYTGLLRRDSWNDGIEFMEDITAWAQQYEVDFMVPAATNKQTADELVRLLLFYLPESVQPFASQIIGVIMGKRLRAAMVHPTPSPTIEAITYAILSIRRLLLRHLSLPRLCRQREFSEPDPKTGRYHHTEYLVHPYYVKPTFSSRWGPQAWLTWALGGTVPGGKDGMKYSPGGYHFEEVGPENKTAFTKKDLREWESKVEKAIPVGCPFAISR